MEKLIARFWKHVKIIGDCWEWQAARDDHNYGRFRITQKKCERAQRVAWMIENGMDIPSGLFVLHKCDNPPCVRPDHLILGTQKDNMQDCIKKGRASMPPYRFGINHTSIKFSKEQALAIIADKRPVEIVAAEYGVCTKTIYRLWRGDSWYLYGIKSH